MTIKPVNFSNLKKVSGEELRLINSAWSFFPETFGKGDLSIALRKMLAKHLGEKAFYYLDKAESGSNQDLASSLPETFVVAGINLNNGDGTAFIQIDINLAFLLIDRLLGGVGEPSVENRPLSETEQGVLQYLLMQALATVWKAAGESEKVHFRFKKFYFSTLDIAKEISSKESLVSFVFKVGIGEHSGFVRISLSQKFIQKFEQLNAVDRREKDVSSFFDKLRSYHYVRTSLWAEAGKATISSGELSMLEEGDVIVFDDTGLQMINNVPAGSVELKTGKGENGFLRANISAQRGVLKCTILG